MKFQDISRKMKQSCHKSNQSMECLNLIKKDPQITNFLDYIKKDICKMCDSHDIKEQDLEELKEEWDKENKREGLEQIEVKDLTQKILKYCNVIRDKKENSK